jgi:hypothetical protein
MGWADCSWIDIGIFFLSCLLRRAFLEMLWIVLLQRRGFTSFCLHIRSGKSYLQVLNLAIY